MSVEPRDPPSDAATGAARILARAGDAEARAERRLAVAIDDFFLPEDDRLDDRTRAAITALVAGVVGAVERDLVAHAARSSAAIVAGGVLPRLIDSGLLRDRALMAELVGRTREDMLARALDTIVPREEQSGLLSRLADCPDGVVASAASAMLIAESRRRSAPGGRTELPEALHERIVWWVAAALREQAARGAGVDRALAEAAARSLAAHDADDALEAVALRLAAAIDARPAELGDLLIDALADSRAALFVAAIARASGLDYAEARTIVLDPDGDRLWLVLRAHGLDRAALARIGLMLAEADSRRDLEAFADSLDSIAAIERDSAADAIAPMRLHPDFRAAMRALAQTRA